jgi:hypothetical protein
VGIGVAVFVLATVGGKSTAGLVSSVGLAVGVLEAVGVPVLAGTEGEGVGVGAGVSVSGRGVSDAVTEGEGVNVGSSALTTEGRKIAAPSVDVVTEGVGFGRDPQPTTTNARIKKAPSPAFRTFSLLRHKPVRQRPRRSNSVRPLVCGEYNTVAAPGKDPVSGVRYNVAKSGTTNTPGEERM